MSVDWTAIGGRAAQQHVADLTTGAVPVGYSGYVLLGGTPADWATFLAILCSLCLLASYAFRVARWCWVRWHAWRRRKGLPLGNLE